MLLLEPVSDDLGYTYSMTQREKWRTHFTECGLPDYASGNFLDLDLEEERLARREYMAFRTGPLRLYLERQREFSRIVAAF